MVYNLLAMRKKVILVIMDGWGIAPPDRFNAIANAKTPNFDQLVREYPNTLLRSDGEWVGLEAGQFGTSEINHLTIGAGRVIIQDLTKINKSLIDKSFFKNKAFLQTIKHAKDNSGNLHLLGIISDGGVHSHISHLLAILEMIKNSGFTNKIFLHLFSDGRDVPPKSVTKYLKQLDRKIMELKLKHCQIATLQGRYFLDRDRDWAKTEKAFDLIVKGKGNKLTSWEAAVNLEYNNNNPDEYFNQYIFSKNCSPKAGDGIIFFHFRTDRQYQLTKRILDENIANLSIASFVRSSEEFTTLNVAFPREVVSDTLAEVIARNNLTQLHVTETEKFPHTTFFFNGEKEKEFSGETWKLFESNRFIKPKYNFEPSMRNFDITKEIIAAIESDKYDFIVSNLASPDMVGHTGNYEAAVVSAESVDFCLGAIYEALKPKLKNYALLITADHGNSEMMWDYKNNQPHTQHTLSRVPFILVSDIPCKLARRESLEDIAPTVLDLMRLPVPAVMSGTTLIETKIDS